MKKDRLNEQALFYTTILFLLIIGTAFNPDVNKGLFKKEGSQEVETLEKFAPRVTSPSPISLAITPFALGIVIIIAAVWFRDHKNFKIKTKKKKKSSVVAAIFRSMHNEIESIKGFDVKRFIRHGPHKKLKEVVYPGFNEAVSKEATRTKELFVKNYREEFTDKFIALAFIVAAVGMAAYALTPGLNPGLVADGPEIISISIIQPQPEQLAPQPLTLGIGVLVGLIIVISAAAIKLKKEK